MQRKIVMSLFMIAFGCVMVGGATVAYFTDTATNDNNIFSTGIVEIETANLDGSTLSTQSISDMLPGDEEDFSFKLVNNSSVDIIVRGSIETDAVLNEESIFAQQDEDVNCASATTGAGFPDDWTILQAGSDLPVTWSVSLPAAAGNNYQGKSGTVSLSFDAMQALHNDKGVPYPQP